MCHIYNLQTTAFCNRLQIYYNSLADFSKHLFKSKFITSEDIKSS